VGKNRGESVGALPSLIGVIHLPALAGSPGARGIHPALALERAGAWALAEARTFEKAGFDGLILENFGDSPFYKSQVPPETISSLAVIAAALRESTRLKLGINVLRNDAASALAIASVTGCEFIRVNVLSGVSAADQGLIEGDAARILRERDRLMSDVRILADAEVKHARSLSSQDLGISIEELFARSNADAVILTGDTTGRVISAERLRDAWAGMKALKKPVYLGSGVNAENISEFRAKIHGVIISSSLRKGGIAGAPLEPSKVRAFSQAFKKSKRARSR